ncbi:MAG: ATPase [Deltaproteobacteria bacterium]|nr:ATPase [Deltaproteobacteria bacterium]
MSPLLRTPLTFVTGKGGVGKSTVAAALACGCAAGGERTALIALGPHPFARLFNTETPIHYHGAEVAPRLTAFQLTPREAFEEYAVLRLGSAKLYHLCFDNRFVHYFLDATPGLNELMCLGKLWHLVVKAHVFERVIVDLPATGHGLGFLDVPRILTESVHRGPLATLGEQMRSMLQDTAVTATLIVTRYEELPVNETLELADRLATPLCIPLAGVVANHATAAPVPADLRRAWETLQHDTAPDAPWRPAIAATAFLDQQWARAQTERERLHTRFGALLHELPTFPVEAGPDLLARIGETLATW